MARSSHYVPRCVLVGHRACSAPRRNATTAWSKTSTGMPIAVTFCAARPPAVSHIFVNCPGIKSSDASLSPQVITEDANLVVLRVPLDSRSRIHNRHSDYFVYRVDPRRPSLDLLPNPIKPTFKLHLYRSNDGNQSMWSCQLLSVEKPLRDKFPVPDSADMKWYHLFTKVIILGGDKGIVGWVDLWRGILLCNVLSLNPKLLDIPLPPSAKGNLENYLNRCPTYFRDITVNQTKDTIKYVEMEITPPEEVFVVPPGMHPNWVLYDQCLPPYITPGSWTTTTYKMPMEVGSVHKWEKVCTVDLGDLDTSVDNERVHKLMNILLRTSDNKKKVLETTKGTRMGSMRGLVTVDMSEKTLEGVELLDAKRHNFFMRPFVASGISNYRKTAVTLYCDKLSFMLLL
ncbi:hypothetical protein QOZ80_3BG0283490 [Eleusine coracana subsp. coracana]|nr:hypothetical protein QOZ80_3BG0283490 [Eleusine coracana subsp. coracana]